MKTIGWAVVMFGVTSVAWAGVPAKKALEIASTQFGRAAFQHLVSIKGESGSPNPSEWTILAYDPANDYKLRNFWVGEAEATNEGIDYSYYPGKEVPGFIPLARFKIDSTKALKVAEKAATAAQVGFDSISYELRCREFSKEPVWTLHLTDSEGYRVGTIHLSAENGDLLRTIWRDYKLLLPSGQPRIRDSAFPKAK